MDEKLHILADGSSPRNARKIKSILRLFRQTWGSSARVISLLDSESDWLSEVSRVERWVDVFPYETYYDLCSLAYERTDSLIAGLQPESSTLLRNFYHEVANVILRSIVFDKLIGVITSPVALVQKYSRGADYKRTSAKVIRLNRTLLPSFAKFLGIYLRRQFTAVRTPRFSKAGNEANQGDIAGRVLVSIEDTGSDVNLSPGLKILDEMRRRGMKPIVISTWPRVVKAVRIAGFVAQSLATPSLKLNPVRIVSRKYAIASELSAALKRNKGNEPETMYLREIRARVLEYAALESNTRTILDGIHSLSPVAAMLLVNETAFMAPVFADWATSRQIPIFGFNPVLMGNRPDYKYFPADSHLVYGEQIRAFMTRIGIPSDAIHVVGTPTFDNAHDRNREEDRKTVAGRILRHWRPGEKLVVVGTEALPQPFVELGPILRTVGEMADVHVTLKVHPSESLDFYQRFVDTLACRKTIEVIKECDVYALLNTADLLICIISNIIVSAAILGTPTLVCDFSGKRKPLDFVKEGLSFGCFSSDRIEPMVRDLLFNPDTHARWQRMRQQALIRFNGENDGQSHCRIVDFVAERMGQPELCPTT